MYFNMNERITQSLNGYWDYRIGLGRFGKKKVPYSSLQVGLSECRLDFDADSNALARAKRVFLVFEAITYSATVTLNGEELGKMLPYCRYRYEIGDILKKNGNVLSVVIRDIGLPFGPTDGWECYSGIISDVYLEYTPETVIDDVTWTASLPETLDTAACKAVVTIDGIADGVEAKLLFTDKYGAKIHAEKKTVGADGKCDITFTVASPELWSPDTPYLYDLRVEITKGGSTLDVYTHRIGFRSFVTKGKRFYLNGEPIFFIGVCRHDLWGDNGHILTKKQMYDDMKMIKDGGVNYVRLVHYPHNRYILDLADELGLFVSEEPGLWWQDVADPEIYESSLEVLRRTIIRDRNHVALAFWLSFNECIFTPEYLVASAKVCRENDPTRMVSGANCMDIPMTKKHFFECGLDFYTMHPYAPTTERMIESARELCDLPLLLTEWGGFFVYDNPNLFRLFVRDMVKLWNNPDDEPVITGATYWCFNEMYQFTRSAPACYDGILREGLVDPFRKPTMIWQVYQEEFAKIKNPDTERKYTEVIPFYPEADAENLIPIPIDEKASVPCQDEIWAREIKHALETEVNGIDATPRTMKYGPCVTERIDFIGNLPVKLRTRPYVVTKDAPLEIDLPENTAELYTVGCTSIIKGFPMTGVLGEDVALLTFTYADGAKEALPIRNGVEMTTCVALHCPSRINPVAAEAPRALYIVQNFDKEIYVANMLRLLPERKHPIKAELGIVGEDYNLLVYGFTAKTDKADK